MRLPSFRFTIRRMMIAVAIVGLFLGLVSYSQRLRAIAARHESQAFRVLQSDLDHRTPGPPGTIGRRIPGQRGVSFYQPTPPGMEQIENRRRVQTLGRQDREGPRRASLLALIIFTIGRFFVHRSRSRGVREIDWKTDSPDYLARQGRRVREFQPALRGTGARSAPERPDCEDQSRWGSLNGGFRA